MKSSTLDAGDGNVDIEVAAATPTAATTTNSTTELSPLPPQPAWTPPAPSFSLLFSYLTRRDVYTLLLPAILVSLVSGGVAPFMTRIIGFTFDAFAAYPLSTLPHDQAKDKLMHDITLGALELLGLSAGTLLLSSLMATLWMWVGERNALRLRKSIYKSVTSREMEWFDLKMGQDDQNQSSSSAKEQSDTGAGGMMSKFSRETDDVRQATAINAGMLIQYATTFFACLILALIESWSLTLVILASIPLMVFIQGLCQAFATPFYNTERNKSSSAGTRIERAVSSIATVKAFNAQKNESTAVSNIIHAGRRAYMRCSAIWGVTAGITQFILFAMFVQGFWYGSKLVREGKISPGNVMGVFWACLVASSNLQLCIPLLVVQTKGKAAMVSLDTLINQPLPSSSDHRPVSVMSPTSKAFPHTPKEQVMMKIMPQGKCRGSFALHNVRFAYPSRPGVRVLAVDEIFIPDGETTFIVGSSGSGKSTIAQLLLRMYEPGSGTILFDDNDLAHLERRYTRQHVASVSQTCILFDMTVHENVAMGLKCAAAADGGREATRQEVEKACQAALMHEFVRDLPDGYDTRLGTGGASLSGGQRQRLAIARAMLRDPTVLILDEATSALDATSRVLVTEAIKTWRKKKTTIVITHDLSQIGHEDFVYVLKNGEVVERGYREELEKSSGEFKRMGEIQKFAQDEDDEIIDTDPESEAEEEEEVRSRSITSVIAKTIQRASKLPFASWTSAAAATTEGGGATVTRALSTNSKHNSSVPGGASKKWMFDAIADLTNDVPSEEVRQAAEVRASHFLAAGAGQAPLKKKLAIVVHGRDGTVGPGIPKSRTSVQFAAGGGRHAAKGSKHQSLQFEPISPPAEKTTMWSNSAKEKEGELLEDDEDFERYKDAMRATGTAAGAKRQGSQGALRVRRSQNDLAAKVVEATSAKVKLPTLTGTVRRFFPTIPNKLVIAFGMLLCLVNGAMTPLFSVALANLMNQVGSGANDVHLVAFWGKIVLFIALADGVSAGTRFFVMENAAMHWVAKLRIDAYNLVLEQDKTFFDDPEHNAGKIVQRIIKDGDDIRSLIGSVLSQGLVTVTMILVGFLWALVLGWQLTLVGFAIAPVFGLAMAGQSILMSKFELRSKRAREKVEKRYFDTVSSVRAIRSMALEEVFCQLFDEAADGALEAGVHGAFVAGGGYGVANGLVYLAQAVIFYVGAVMLSNGTYSYLKMLTVLNLVVFTMSIAAQLMTFIPKIAKSTQAATDLDTLLSLKDTPTRESQGALRFPIRGDICFENVGFAYPQRADAPILKQLSFTIRDGECVAIVGASGCGKSTIASLLQRLYEPTSGRVTFSQRFQLQDAEVMWLRSHIAVVSQHAALFDASIKDNILYGLESDSVPFHEVQRAARDANLDSVIAGLPDKYDTLLGENAALISGGQAQRIQLARALVNGKANVLILDEFTSALDVDNQEALMATVMNLKEGRTTVIVTHKLPVMRKCDRILVVDAGAIVEQGSYDALMANKGHFWTLASAGEWAD